MSSLKSKDRSEENAERRFRNAFEKLRNEQSRRSGMGTMFTQADVAREAGCDPSALKKARYPILVAEIQQYLLSQQKRVTNQTPRPSARSTNTPELLAKVKLLQLQRDQALSLLVEADTKILELSTELQKFRAAAKG